jgi:hypothetical protein
MKLPNLSRRSALRGGAALGAAAALGGLDGFAKAWAQASPFKAEAGAKLNVLRGVYGDGEGFLHSLRRRSQRHQRVV